MLKYIFLALFFLVTPASAQRKVEEVVKKEEVKTDNRIDLKKIRKSANQNVCGADSSNAYALVGDLFFPPFSWLAVEGSDIPRYYLNGIGVDYFNHILDKTFKKPFSSNSIIVKTNQEIMKSVLRGSADIHVDTFYDVNPSLGMDFIYPSYLTLHMITITRKGDENTKIATLEDLKKYKGAVRRNENVGWIYNSIGIDIDDSPNVTVLEPEENTVKNMFIKLLKGDVDYIFMNIYSARAEVYRYKLYNNLKINEDHILKTNRIFFAMSQMAAGCRKFIENLKTSLEDDLANGNALHDIVLKNIDKYIIMYKSEPKLEIPLVEKNISDENPEQKNEEVKSEENQKEEEETVPNLI